MYKVSKGEKKMKAQCFAIIQEAMGCEGRKPEKNELDQFLQENLQNVGLWLIAAGALDGKLRFDCLEHALKIDPQNEKIYSLMKQVNLKRAYRVAKRMKVFEYSEESQQPDQIEGV